MSECQETDQRITPCTVCTRAMYDSNSSPSLIVISLLLVYSFIHRLI